MGIRYMANWTMLDMDMHVEEEELEQEEEDHADVWATTDDRQTMGQYHRAT